MSNLASPDAPGASRVGASPDGRAHRTMASGWRRRGRRGGTQHRTGATSLSQSRRESNHTPAQTCDDADVRNCSPGRREPQTTRGPIGEDAFDGSRAGGREPTEDRSAKTLRKERAGAGATRHEKTAGTPRGTRNGPRGPGGMHCRRLEESRDGRADVTRRRPPRHCRGWRRFRTCSGRRGRS
jgi:hypothetical protein